MATKQQLTGMRGVYLVAAELSKLGFIASPTSRSTIGADILATDRSCQKTYSVQVKTNARTFGFWLLNKRTSEQVSDYHIYVLVNIRKTKSGELIDYFVVPSKVVAKKMVHEQAKNSDWYSIKLQAVEDYRDNWSLFEESPV